MCQTFKIFYNYTKCGHSTGAPVHLVGPPCQVANSFKPGHFYCPATIAECRTVFENLDEPCLNCRQTDHWFQLMDKNGNKRWAARMPVAYGPEDFDVREAEEKFRLPFRKGNDTKK